MKRTIITGFTFTTINRTRFLIIHKRTLITGNPGDNRDDSSDSDMSDRSSVSSNHEFDPSNGYQLDRHEEVARNFHGDREGLNNYFEEKESSIRSALESDMQGAIGTEFDTPQHQAQMISEAHSLLAQLEQSKDTIRDLADIPLSESGSDNSHNAPYDTSDNSHNAPHNTSDNPHNFPQDSSDVERTDFMTGFDEEDN